MSTHRSRTELTGLRAQVLVRRHFQDLYYEHFNSGIYRASEALREQVIDVAVDEAGLEQESKTE